jgi:hypothetical protein
MVFYEPVSYYYLSYIDTQCLFVNYYLNSPYRFSFLMYDCKEHFDFFHSQSRKNEVAKSEMCWFSFSAYFRDETRKRSCSLEERKATEKREKQLGLRNAWKSVMFCSFWSNFISFLKMPFENWHLELILTNFFLCKTKIFSVFCY